MMWNSSKSTPLNRVTARFTLLELLLVVFILSSVAVATLFVVEFADEQSRFEETRSRLQQIRRAIIGEQPIRFMNNQPFISGFVADMGRLPENLQELVEPPEDTNNLWSFDEVSGVWRGWRGPYLSALAEIGSDTAVFRDGWGNREDGGLLREKDYGWLYRLAASDTVVNLKSTGANGATDPVDTGYDQDFPSEDDFVQKNDHRVDISSEFNITFKNSTGKAMRTQNLRIGFSYALVAEPAWPTSRGRRNEAVYLSDAFTRVPAMPDGDTRLVTVVFGQGAFSGKKHIPWGRRALVAFLEDKNGSGQTTELADSVIYNSTNIFEFLPRASPPIIPDLEWEFE